MKLETRVKDLAALVAARQAEDLEAKARTRAEHAATDPRETDDRVIALRQVWKEARECHLDKTDKLMRIPADRRRAAQELFQLGQAQGLRVARHGDSFSGETKELLLWGAGADAGSDTVEGEAYSRRSRYRKLDCTHWVMLDPAGIPLLSDHLHDIVAVSQQEGLHIIALYPGCKAVWVNRSRGKLEAETGWVAYDYATRQCYHSTESYEHAEKGLAKKVRVAREEAAQRDPRVQRRLKLIARLCENAKATIADAKALGFCDPGIAAFQSRFGIGDTASLPDLVKTGDPSAVRLALHLAKKIHFKKQPA